MAADRSPGSTLGDYQLESRLGEGGFGDVWQALQISTGRRIALKLLKESAGSENRRRFVREAEALRSFDHPNTLHLVDFGRFDDGTAFLVTDLVQGVTLNRWLRDGRSATDVLNVMTQVGAALTYAHERGIIHRDLKPDNVMIVSGSQGPRAIVLDFGIAKLVGQQLPDLTKTGEVLGTPGYMSPEQLRGQVDIGQATDQYALGVMLFEALEGRPLFRGRTPLELGMNHLTADADLLSERHPEHLRSSVARMLAKDPSKRFPSVRTAVDSWRRRDGTVERAVLSSRSRGRSLWPAITVLAILVAAVVATIASQEPQLPSDPLDDTPPPPAQPAAVKVERSDWECPGLKAGLAERNLERPGGEEHALVYVPAGLKPEQVAGVVGLFGDGSQWSADRVRPAALEEAGVIGTDAPHEAYLFAYAGLRSLADRENLIIVVPRAQRSDGTAEPTRAWADVEAAWAEVTAAREAMCVRDAPIMLIGEGEGAVAVDQLICRFPAHIAAAAVSAHRYRREHRTRGEICEPQQAVPYMQFVQTQFPAMPVDGGAKPRCGVGRKGQWTWEKQLSRLRDNHQCANTRFAAATWAAGECRDLDCKVPLRTCMVDGGRSWPNGQGNHQEFPRDCAGAASNFAYPDVVWNFFERVIAQSPAQPLYGCGVPAPGLGRIRLPDPEVEDGHADPWVHVPTTYDPERSMPLVVFFHQDLDGGPGDQWQQTGLDRLGEERGFITLVPRGGKELAWPKAEIIERADYELRLVRNALCVDSQRIFAIGHGRGGFAAFEFRCRQPELAALATTAYARAIDEERCEPLDPVPFFLNATMKSLNTPPQGRTRCEIPLLGKQIAPKIPLRELEEELRQMNQCEGEPRTFRVGAEQCFEWSCKGAALQSCHIEAGGGWPGSLPRGRHQSGLLPIQQAASSCDGPTGDFRFGHHIWEFFERVSPR